MAALTSDWLTHFQLLKNGWRDLLQTYHKCSWWGPDQVLLPFKPIRNPIWPPWPLIGWHIFNFFSRTAEGLYSKLATNVPYKILTKCCYYLSRSKSNVATLVSDWLTYKKFISHFVLSFSLGFTNTVKKHVFFAPSFSKKDPQIMSAKNTQV